MKGKLYKNQFRTAYFTTKMKINHLGMWNIPFPLQTLGTFRPFLIPWEKYFDEKHGTYMCFPRKSQKFVTFLRKMQEISALEANIDSFEQILVKYLPLPHTHAALV